MEIELQTIQTFSSLNNHQSYHVNFSIPSDYDGDDKFTLKVMKKMKNIHQIESTE